jgi:hypothetical protein
MARSISVKVAKDKVVKALQAKVANNAKVVAKNEKIREDYKKDQDKWQKTIIKDYAKALTLESVNTRWNNRLEITYQLDKSVELPAEPTMGELERELGRYEIEEIENAIRILQMSDEEFVSASTMKQIASYL